MAWLGYEGWSWGAVRLRLDPRVEAGTRTKLCLSLHLEPRLKFFVPRDQMDRALQGIQRGSAYLLGGPREALRAGLELSIVLYKSVDEGFEFGSPFLLFPSEGSEEGGDIFLVSEMSIW